MLESRPTEPGGPGEDVNTVIRSSPTGGDRRVWGLMDAEGVGYFLFEPDAEIYE